MGTITIGPQQIAQSETAPWDSWNGDPRSQIMSRLPDSGGPSWAAKMYPVIPGYANGDYTVTGYKETDVNKGITTTYDTTGKAISQEPYRPPSGGGDFFSTMSNLATDFAPVWGMMAGAQLAGMYAAGSPAAEAAATEAASTGATAAGTTAGAGTSYAPGMLGSGSYGLDTLPTGLESFSTPAAVTPWTSGLPAATGAAASGMLGGATNAAGELIGAGTAAEGAASMGSNGLLSSLGIDASNGKLLATGAGLLGGYLNGQSAKDAAATSAQAQIEAARIAADAAKFRPVGVTSRFGASQFIRDANGNITGAGYTLSPEMKAQQDALMGVSNNMLSQYQGAQAATAPMGRAAQSMMTLGNGYLASSPQEQAQKWMTDQQALLAGSRATDYANMQNRLQNTGRAGLSIGGGGGMTAANPEMQAYYNALNQQNLGLASQATQQGQQYAKFGADMAGLGGTMLRDMYGTQSAAYTPYQTALGGATGIEGLGQNALDMGLNIGAKGQASGAITGQLLQRGLTGAAQTMQPANAYNPLGVGLMSAGNSLSNYTWGT